MRVTYRALGVDKQEVFDLYDIKSFKKGTDLIRTLVNNRVAFEVDYHQP